MADKKKKNDQKIDGDDNAICQSCQKTNIVNGLLSYVSTYYDKASRQQLKLAVISFYGEADVNEAKTKLFDGTSDLELDIENVRRMSSQNRSAKEAEVDDILDVFAKLDTCPVKPHFYVEDVTTLPPASPEAGSSLMSVMELLAKQQREMQQLQKSLIDISKDVQRNTSDISNVSARLQPRQAYQDSYASAVGSMHAYPAAGAGARPKTKINNANTPLQEYPPLRLTEKSDEVKLAESWKDITIPSTEFTKVTRKPKRDSKLKVKCGTAAADGTGLTAGPDNFQVQITNVNPNISVDDIKGYIAKRSSDIAVKDIEDTSSEGWMTKRYLLTFERECYTQVMSDDFWPERIYYKQWFKPRMPKRDQPGDFSTK